MTEPRPANRLIDSTSPYLLQHAHNPVAWNPWGEEALRRSREEDRPIFLSIGYAACHWCHVMERESFESEAVAEVLNREFIPIKVDREERPDLDEIYMTATQLMTGSGGWPMSVFLTPDLKPFYAGTYFPPDDRWGRPGFRTLLTELARLWKSQRADLEKRAAQASEAIAEIGSGREGEGDLQPELVRRAVTQLSRGFDPANGGFGSAPKFPPTMRLELLLRHLEGRPELRRMTDVTLERMARGGMYDQVGGGFHRYSVDAEWLVPHFEKMLYDNALLARVYTLAYERTGIWYYGRVARETFDYVLREMTSREGGFYSTTDADSEGEEGKFFLWDPEEVRQVLGAEDADLFCRVYDVTPRGNFEGRSIPNLLRKGLAERAAELGTDDQALDARLAPLRRKLWEHREGRVHPLLDDKILAAWNGLMIRALAEGFRVFRDERYRQAAEGATGFVLDRMRDEAGRLLRSYRGGKAHLNAYLEDYAYLAAGLLDLHAATGAGRWREEGLALLDRMHERFWDERAGGYFFTSHDHEALIARVKSLQDNATPSGNSMAALALIRAARLTGRDEYRERAARLLSGMVPQMEEMPAAFPNSVIAADEYLVEWPQGQRRPGSDAVELEAYLSRSPVEPGEVFWAAVKLTLKEGYHVNSSDPSQPYQIPTRLVLESGVHLSVARESYPPGQEYHGGDGETLSVYTGETLMGLEVRVDAEAEYGRYEVVVSVVTQPCDDQACYPPVQARVRIPLEVAEECGPDVRPEIFDGVRATAGPLLD